MAYNNAGNKQMPKTFIHKRRVEFFETDVAGIVHFSNFFRYMEAAESDFFRKLDLTLYGENEGIRHVGWPRGEVSCRYEAPLKFEDIIEIHLSPLEIREKTITYELAIYKKNNDTLLKVAHGKSTAICVTLDPVSGQMKAVPIPNEIIGKINAYFKS